MLSSHSLPTYRLYIIHVKNPDVFFQHSALDTFHIYERETTLSERIIHSTIYNEQTYQC